MFGAVRELRSRGYEGIETHTPYPVPDVPAALGFGRPRLPWLVAGAGVLGALVGYGIQFYGNVLQYPQNAGGRPPHAIPAFILITFEGAVVFAAVAAFIGFLVKLRLPRPWRPIFESEGFESASSDRFWVGIARPDDAATRERALRLLDELGASRLDFVEGS